MLGFVNGSRWGQATPRKLYSDGADEQYPRDSAVVFGVLRAAKSFSDIYPGLSKVDPQTPWLLPPEVTDE